MDLYRHMQDMLKKYDEKWFELGTLLNISREYMLRVQENSNRSKIKLSCFKILRIWLHYETYATWGRIIDAVHDLPITVFSGMDIYAWLRMCYVVYNVV